MVAGLRLFRLILKILTNKLTTLVVVEKVEYICPEVFHEEIYKMSWRRYFWYWRINISGHNNYEIVAQGLTPILPDVRQRLDHMYDVHTL